MTTGRLMVTRVGCSGGTAIAVVSETPVSKPTSCLVSTLLVHLEVQIWWRIDN